MSTSEANPEATASYRGNRGMDAPTLRLEVAFACMPVITVIMH